MYKLRAMVFIRTRGGGSPVIRVARSSDRGLINIDIWGQRRVSETGLFCLAIVVTIS